MRGLIDLPIVFVENMSMYFIPFLRISELTPWSIVLCCGRVLGLVMMNGFADSYVAVYLWLATSSGSASPLLHLDPHS